jgi:hypothetical protein
MIIGFAGRCRSGKTVLSEVCEKYGYQRLSFALPLKQLCADILDISIDELNRAKNERIPIEITIGKDICEILSEETNIPIETTTEICDGKYLHTVRDMLQFIGTDYIRKYNSDWHVNKIKEIIKNDVNYVIDDVRFPNEKRMIEELGGDCWFVTRTTLDNVSNHESETSITWKDCMNKVIVNNSTLNELLFKWEIFMDNYTRSCAIRDEEFNKILENGLNEGIASLSVLSVLMLSPSLFDYCPKDIDKNSVDSITMNEDKSVFIKYIDGSVEMVDHPLIIEDLKIYVS